MVKKPGIRSLSTLFISLFILIILIEFADPKKVFFYISRSDLKFLLLGFLLWCLSMILRNIRWKILLSQIGVYTDFLTSFKALVAGIGVSNITPGKVGDPLRAYFLKKETGANVSRVVTSVFIERFLDLLGLIILGLFGAFLLYGTEYFKYFIISTSIYFIGFLVFVFVSISEYRVGKVFSMFYSVFKFLPRMKNIENEIDNMAKNFHKAFKKYSEPYVLFISFLLSLVIWILESLVVYFSLLSINAIVSPLMIIIINPVIVLVSVLTLLPGGLGTGDAISVFVYSKMLGLNVSQLTAMTILARSVSFWPSVIFGLIMVTRIKERKTNQVR